MTLAYNLIMAVVDLAALANLRRQKRLLVWAAGIGCLGMIALVLAVVLGENHFVISRLAAYGLFGHLVFVLLAAAGLLWRSRRIAAVGSGLMAAALLAIAADAFLIEPEWLDVSHVRIATGKIDRPLRIVVLADLQTDRIGPYERSVLQRTLQADPDLILLAGDYLQPPWPQRGELYGQLNALLRELDFRAAQGVFAVRGNIDPSDWMEIFKGLDVNPVDSTRSFELDCLRLTCLDLYDSYNPQLHVENDAPDRFHLVVGHVPNFALGRVDADLLVAGHTHGGQVRFPFIGPVFTHALVPNDWAAGLTELPGGGRLLVSRGVGMERCGAPRMRFLCRPEIVVVDLIPADWYNAPKKGK